MIIDGPIGKLAEKRKVLFVNAVIWLDPNAGGANEQMWRAKMAWVRIAPCLFVAVALPLLASGVFSHPSSELRRCELLLLFERTRDSHGRVLAGRA